jgi:peroxiredoxin
VDAARYDPETLPADLPEPVDDGAAGHLSGRRLPDVILPATDGALVRLDRAVKRTIVYAYPRTGRPGAPALSPDWDAIPGARGCTPESCAFRDHHGELEALGANVYGLSTQDTAYQREAARRLRLPFPLLSDAELRLARALALPTFEVVGQTLHRRLTFVVREGEIEHVWYPVFPPDRHAEEVVGWLRATPAG